MTTTKRPGSWTDSGPGGREIVRLVPQSVPSQRIDPRDHRNLWHVARIQAELDAATELLVLDARTAGKSWSWVGEQLGVSKQAAAKRWSYLDDIELCEHTDVTAFTWKAEGRIRHGGRCDACGEVLDAQVVALDDVELPAELVDAVHAGSSEPCTGCSGQGRYRAGSSGRLMRCRACDGSGVKASS